MKKTRYVVPKYSSCLCWYDIPLPFGIRFSKSNTGKHVYGLWHKNKTDNFITNIIDKVIERESFYAKIAQILSFEPLATRIDFLLNERWTSKHVPLLD